jgi:hypothetical protein
MTTINTESSNSAVTLAGQKSHDVMYQVVRRRTPEDALVAVTGYIECLAREKKWREITGGQYNGLHDALPYVHYLAEEVSKKLYTEEPDRHLFIAKTLIELLARLNPMCGDEHKTFDVLGEAAMIEILAAPGEEGLKVLHSLVEVRNEDVVRGAGRAIKGTSTETALYFIEWLSLREGRGYNDLYQKFRTFFWYCIAGRESVENQVIWASIVGKLQVHEKKVRELPYDKRNMPVKKEDMQRVCLGHIEKMCEFAWKVRELHILLAEMDVPINKEKILIDYDLLRLAVTKIVIPINTMDCRIFYDTQTWKPIATQQRIVALMKENIEKALVDFARKFNINIRMPEYMGYLNHPEKKPEQSPALEPVPV